MIARYGYTILDYFSDIGGMKEFLISGFMLLIMISNFENLDTYMVTRLYKLKSD